MPLDDTSGGSRLPTVTDTSVTAKAWGRQTWRRTVPKNQTTASKKARAVQRTAGGKHTENLRAAQTCGVQLDPWGQFPERCARPPHTSDVHSRDPHFDEAAWNEQMAAEDAAAKARWDALTPEQQAEAEERQRESEYDDGRTASDDYEDARAYKWED